MRITFIPIKSVENKSAEVFRFVLKATNLEISKKHIFGDYF